MIFTEEELEMLVGNYKIEGEDNQELVSLIHQEFGGILYEKDTHYYNHVRFDLFRGQMYFVYSDTVFVYKSPTDSAENVNHWKLKKLIEVMKNELKKDKELKLKMKMKNIEKDF